MTEIPDVIEQMEVRIIGDDDDKEKENVENPEKDDPDEAEKSVKP